MLIHVHANKAVVVLANKHLMCENHLCEIQLINMAHAYNATAKSKKYYMKY